MKAHRLYTGTIRLRRTEQLRVRPECEGLDGKRITVRCGWMIDDDDRYPGEYAMIITPFDPALPIVWIASGDLELDAEAHG